MIKRFITYLCEALGLGVFMISATLATVLIEHPYFHVHDIIKNEFLCRLIIGISMGLTAFYILNSPFGKRSGAHINPSVTIVQYRLGNINGIDAFFYILFQFLGGTAGVYLIYLLLPRYVADSSVNYIVTIPSAAGVAVAFILELLISFLLITTVLYSNTNKSLSRYTASFVAILIALFIAFEAPSSGMSMNPARTFSSALVSGEWNSFWLYCTAPPLGMICGELFITRILKLKLPKVSLHND